MLLDSVNVNFIGERSFFLFSFFKILVKNVNFIKGNLLRHNLEIDYIRI